MIDSTKQNNSKIKILFVHPSLEVGGAEDLRFITLRRLARSNRYDIKVCCIEKVGEIGEKIKGLGIEVFCLNRSAKPYNLFATISLLMYLRRNHFDIIQASLFNANFHGRIAAILARVPIIISEEHSEHYQYNSLKFLPYIWSDKILSGFTDQIICCSRNLMNSIAKREDIPLAKFFPLINTFNADKLKVNKDKLQIKRELGLTHNDIIIGNVASLTHRKGQDILIKAFSMVSDKFPLAKLIFIGAESQEFKQKLLVLIKDLDLSEKVLFLGKKDNVADYFNIMDIFVLSSVFEGLPLAMLEAMYMRVPVVAVDIGGVSEVITNDKSGILVKSNDIESLSTAIRGLLNDKEKQIKLAAQARETILKEFTSERYINRLENLYVGLGKKHGGLFE